MSRIGKRPVAVPQGVDIRLDGTLVTVKGKNGELQQRLPETVEVKLEDGQFVVERQDDSRGAREAHGLARTLISNMVTGVSEGFSVKLLIEGVGYRAELRGDNYILFTLGYSHPILFRLPDGLSAEINPKENSVTVSGADKQVVGTAAAKIRGLRPPEPYKGKGIRYATERIRRKEGKARSK